MLVAIGKRWVLLFFVGVKNGAFLLLGLLCRYAGALGLNRLLLHRWVLQLWHWAVSIFRLHPQTFERLASLLQLSLIINQNGNGFIFQLKQLGWLFVVLRHRAWLAALIVILLLVVHFDSTLCVHKLQRGTWSVSQCPLQLHEFALIGWDNRASDLSILSFVLPKTVAYDA